MQDEQAVKDATAMTDAELIDALKATESEQARIALPKAVHDALRWRAQRESAFMVGDRRINVSQGQLVVFLWQHFVETYGEPNGQIAAFVAAIEDLREAREAEALHRGYDPKALPTSVPRKRRSKSRERRESEIDTTHPLA